MGLANSFVADFRDVRGNAAKQKKRAEFADRRVLQALNDAAPAPLCLKAIMHATGLSQSSCEGAFRRLARRGAIEVAHVLQSNARLFGIVQRTREG